MTDTIVTIVDTVETVSIETVEVGQQGPPGRAGVIPNIEQIDGGEPDTDFSADYEITGGAP